MPLSRGNSAAQDSLFVNEGVLCSNASIIGCGDPFQKENGYCHYPEDLMEQMENFLAKKLEEKISREKIFRWKTGDSVKA